jgi:stage III sporulation protein AF
MYWKEWLQSLLGLVILLGILEMILPAGELAKFSRLVFGLVLMLAVLQPLIIILDQGLQTWDLAWGSEPLREPEVQRLAESVQLAATRPFLTNNQEAVASQIEGMLLGLDYVDDAMVQIRVAGQRDVLVDVWMRPFAVGSGRSVGELVGSVLHIPVTQVLVQPWVE